MDDFTVDHMTGEEASVCLGWAKAEGWNPGLHDADVFFRTDPDGFFAARLNGVMVGSVSVVSYPGGFKFGGLFIVRPDLRNSGVGRRLISHVLRYSEGSNLGIDGVLQMSETYESYGFVPAYRNARYLGRAAVREVIMKGLAPLSSVPIDRLAEYDSNMFPSERKRFLELWTRQPDSFGLASLEDGQIKGYGLIRRCVAGHKVGPFFADDVVTAENLLSALTSTIPGEEFSLDVPMPNRLAIDLAAGFGMREVFSTLRMYTMGSPKTDLDRVFGITSFELG